VGSLGTLGFCGSNRSLVGIRALRASAREPFSSGEGSRYKSPVRHKRGINFLTPILNFRRSVNPLPGLPAPLSSSTVVYYSRSYNPFICTAFSVYQINSRIYYIATKAP